MHQRVRLENWSECVWMSDFCLCFVLLWLHFVAFFPVAPRKIQIFDTEEDIRQQILLMLVVTSEETTWCKLYMIKNEKALASLIVRINRTPPQCLLFIHLCWFLCTHVLHVVSFHLLLITTEDSLLVLPQLMKLLCHTAKSCKHTGDPLHQRNKGKHSTNAVFHNQEQK